MKNKILLGLIVFLAFFFRVYRLGEVPPSLYWDEASLGYNAYSIATTLRDEHGEFLPLTRFIAFGDYKAPGYIYVDAIFVKLFGLSEFSTRLPSALAGTLLVLITFLLVKELLDNRVTGLLASLILAFSPWSLQLSRGAFEANLATLFSATGVLFFLIALRKKSFFNFAFCFLNFTLAMYTFNTHKIFVPILVFSLTIIFRSELIKKWKSYIFCLLIFLLLLTPLALYSTTREARLRLDEVSWLKDVEPIELSNSRTATDNYSLIGKIIHNRRVVYSLQFLKHYTDIFQSDFLFFTGDKNFRLSTQAVGQLYLMELPFLLAGIYFLVKNRTKASALLFSWALLAPIPAAFARETPHALRTLNILPAPQILIAVGLIVLLKSLKNLNTLKFLILFFYLLSFIFYLRDYYYSYPVKYSSSWQYGYKQAVAYVNANQSNYDRVSITGDYGRPYIYFLYYQKYLPQNYWQTRNVDRDWFGFWYVHGFDKYSFGDDISQSGKSLYLRGPGKSPDGAKILTTVKDLENSTIFEISEKSF